MEKVSLLSAHQILTWRRLTNPRTIDPDEIYDLDPEIIQSA
jgi:hypothetical protein